MENKKLYFEKIVATNEINIWNESKKKNFNAIQLNEISKYIYSEIVKYN